jgi:hypothetical protein
MNKTENTYGTVKVVQRSDYKWGVIDIVGKEILPVIYDAIWNFL